MAKAKGYQLFLMGMVAILSMIYVSISIEPPFDTSQYVEADLIDVADQTVYIGYNCTAIVADTSQERAESIALGLEGWIDQRPNTHDIFSQTLKTFNITLNSVTVDSYNGQFYYSSMIFYTPTKMLKLDAKPTDAIAVALRTKTPIYINKTLLAERGQTVC